jgi:hypothetical protein
LSYQFLPRKAQTFLYKHPKTVQDYEISKS